MRIFQKQPSSFMKNNQTSGRARLSVDRVPLLSRQHQRSSGSGLPPAWAPGEGPEVTLGPRSAFQHDSAAEPDPTGGQGRGRSNAESFSSHVTSKTLIITFSSAFLLPTSSNRIQTPDHIFHHVTGSDFSGGFRSPQKQVPAAMGGIPPQPMLSGHGPPPWHGRCSQSTAPVLRAAVPVPAHPPLLARPRTLVAATLQPLPVSLPFHPLRQ